MEKIDVLFKIYEVVTDYLCGRSDDEQLECLNEVVDLYMQICNDEGIPEEIDGLLQCAVNHINHDVESTTLQAHIADGHEIIESLSGYLGEYFE